MGVSGHYGHVYLLYKEANSPAFLPLNVLEKVIFLEQFHGQYIVIGIQAVTREGLELHHVHSIVVKVGGSCAQFNVDGVINNLSSLDHGKLAELLRSKYSPWMAIDVDSEIRRLNQILQLLKCYS